METRENILLRVPPSIKAGIVQIARERGVTVNGLINQILWLVVKEADKESGRRKER